MMNNSKLLTSDEARKIIGVSKGWISTGRSAGIGPAFIRVGKRCMYREEDLDSWINLKTKDNSNNKNIIAMPEWTLNLPRHTLIAGSEIKEIFSLPKNISLLECISSGVIPRNGGTYKKKGVTVRSWCLGAVRDFVKSTN